MNVRSTASLLLTLLGLLLLTPADAVACSMVQQWVWDGPTSDTVHPEVCTTPVVVQLTDDDNSNTVDSLDFPDVVFTHFDDTVSGYPARITALDGRTGTELFNILSHHVELNGLAAGDLDDDGYVDLVAIEFGGQRLLAFERTGALKWAGPTLPFSLNQGNTIALANVDGVGQPEILVGRHLFNADGSLRWSGASYIPWGNANVSHAHDIDPVRPGLEIVAGNTLYASDGSIIWRRPAMAGPSLAADLDGDGVPEIVLASNDSVIVYDALGNTVCPPIVIPPNQGTLGQPAAADIDGDGVIELIVAHYSDVIAFKLTGGVLAPVWSVGVFDFTGASAPAAYDFDGDGRLDVVYHDEVDWYVFDGPTGTMRSRISFPSDSGIELPVIADIDNDCRTEVILGGCRRSGASAQLRAYECATAPSARPIWNQYSYSVTNVDDDGSIPAAAAPAWSRAATFEAQVPRATGATADAGPPQEICPGDSAVLDGSGSQPCDPSGLRYRWLEGPVVLCPLSADPTCLVTPSATTVYTLEVECVSGSMCPGTERATTVVSHFPAGCGCGNGVLEAGEGCDDGNLIDCDGCSATCVAEVCGDGVQLCDEECDDGNGNGDDLCAVDCTLTHCGDGILQSPNGTGLGGPLGDGQEGCDDGNAVACDGCAASCRPEVCGDGIVECTEACDDGNQIPGDGCTDCQVDVCDRDSIGPVQLLLAVKSFDQASVVMTFSPDPWADGYNVWHVADKTLISAAREGTGVAQQPSGCDPTATSSCWHIDAVPPSAGRTLFYQARGTCRGSEAVE